MKTDKHTFVKCADCERLRKNPRVGYTCRQYMLDKNDIHRPRICARFTRRNRHAIIQ